MNKKVLQRFLSNRCSYQECEAVFKFLENNEDELDAIEIFENLQEDEIIHNTVFQKQRVFHTIISPRSRVFSVRRIVAVAIVLFFCLFSFYQLRVQDKSTSISHTASIHLSNEGSTGKWFTLPDQSRVKLESHAKISYKSDFIFNRILTQLEGEVTYFVEPDKSRPFRVVNQGVQTRAIGTIFSIAPFDENNLSVKLLEGQIVIEDENNVFNRQIAVRDQETLLIDKTNFEHKIIRDNEADFAEVWTTERKKNADYSITSSVVWSNQIVDFKGVSNDDLFNIMERLFSITIDVENPEIINGNFTGQLYRHDDLKSLLKIFCQMNGCTFTVDNDIIRIK